MPIVQLSRTRFAIWPSSRSVGHKRSRPSLQGTIRSMLTGSCCSARLQVSRTSSRSNGRGYCSRRFGYYADRILPILENAVVPISLVRRDENHRAFVIFDGFEQTHRLLGRHLDLSLLSRFLRLLLILLFFFAGLGLLLLL